MSEYPKDKDGNYVSQCARCRFALWRKGTYPRHGECQHPELVAHNAALRELPKPMERSQYVGDSIRESTHETWQSECHARVEL